MGSRVPECPVFSTLKIRLIHATTSCELGREGLSRHITPELKSEKFNTEALPYVVFQRSTEG